MSLHTFCSAYTLFQPQLPKLLAAANCLPKLLASRHPEKIEPRSGKQSPCLEGGPVLGPNFGGADSGVKISLVSAFVWYQHFPGVHQIAELDCSRAHFGGLSREAQLDSLLEKCQGLI